MILVLIHGLKMQAPKKNRKINLNGGSNDQGDQSNNNIIGSDGQSSSSCCSDDDNVSQSDSKPPPALNLNGKTRASRGSATDPQSLYARVKKFLNFHLIRPIYIYDQSC